MQDELLGTDYIIPLTDRAPVAIRSDDWPVIARATVSNEKYLWKLYVRQHADGRAIVHGSCSSATTGMAERYAGRLIDSAGRSDRGFPLEVEIRSTADDSSGLLERSGRLAQACLADLPPEVI
jgi:hypothetical protein